MKVGLYFGSFNPIHNGHLIIASWIINNIIDISQVWFVISPQNPLKPSNLLNEHGRLYLTRIAVEEEKNLKVSDVEFHLPKPSYTIDTLIYLEEKFPQHEFIIILGSDSYQNLPKWKNYDLLIKNYSFIVYARRGFEERKAFSEKTYFVDAPILDISATMIRNLIQSGKSIRYLVPENVREEIEKSGYYKLTYSKD